MNEAASAPVFLSVCVSWRSEKARASCRRRISSNLGCFQEPGVPAPEPLGVADREGVVGGMAAASRGEEVSRVSGGVAMVRMSEGGWMEDGRRKKARLTGRGSRDFLSVVLGALRRHTRHIRSQYCATAGVEAQHYNYQPNVS
ncbi:hypothetical protein Dda_8545 [Drechslerella dactyloides]|uniref:Uncharacterized protein n=1 Tax=Drechslerella dactyloides TaxID=74499 RepID=A0AAD6ISA8_DREDA|nr:hypothetical protein Dda_8545 [Drechslerella dactyloides]